MLMAESEEELKSLLVEVKEESEKAGLKFSIQKTKTMASIPITSWQIDGEKVETLISTFTSSEKNTYFIFLGSKITADGVFSHKIKRHLLLRRKATAILEPRKIKFTTASTFSPSICHEVMGLHAMILVLFFFSNVVSSQLFHSLLSPSSRGSLVPLHLVPLECISEVADTSPDNLEASL